MNAYGLLLRRENSYGSEYLVAEIVRREDNHHAPRNCSDGLCSEFDRPKHLARYFLEGLKMRGFVNESGNEKFIGYEPAYWNVFKVRERDARRMVATLKAINDRIEKDAAHGPVDCLMSLCAALRLSFMVERVGRDGGSSYDNNEWRWMTLGEGRNRYRQMVDEIVSTTVQVA
jgi:hypothetical protein